MVSRSAVLAVVGFLLVGDATHAQTIERFLVPVYLAGPTPGASGTQWVSELRILNSGASNAFIENFGVMNQTGMFFPETLPPGVEIAGRRLNNAGSANNPGALLLVRSEYARQLAFQSRVRDTSRDSEGWGTWLPVIHETQASSHAIHLLDVPVDGRYRLMLRVYSFDQVAGRTVRVRILGARSDAMFPTEEDPLLAEFPLPLNTGGATLQPAYAQYADFALLPTLPGYDRVRVAIEPQADFAIWAMISITNNMTQEVTMVMPNER